jgi:hypothetical protein
VALCTTNDINKNNKNLSCKKHTALVCITNGKRKR